MEFKKQESEYNMFDWWKKVIFDNYANFEGRARRSEYWHFTLVNILIILGLYAFLIVAIVTKIEVISILSLILMIGFSIALIAPSIGVSVRRLHDTNKSGWWYLIGLIPFGGIVLLVFYCTEGDRNNNEFGEEPK